MKSIRLFLLFATMPIRGLAKGHLSVESWIAMFLAVLTTIVWIYGGIFAFALPISGMQSIALLIASWVATYLFICGVCGYTHRYFE